MERLVASRFGCYECTVLILDFLLMMYANNEASTHAFVYLKINTIKSAIERQLRVAICLSTQDANTSTE